MMKPKTLTSLNRDECRFCTGLETGAARCCSSGTVPESQMTLVSLCIWIWADG